MAVSDDWQLSKKTLKDRFSFLFNNELLSDVHFVVGKETEEKQIPSHKLVLSAGSPVFYAMFNGPFAQSSGDNIRLSDIKEDALLALLNYLYSDELDIRPNTVLGVLYAAKKYMVPGLENACVDFLRKTVCPKNALTFLRQARLFDEHELAAQCLEIIDGNPSVALKSKAFLDIGLEMLCEILQRDTLHVGEAQIFDAVVRWSERACISKQVTIDAENKRMVLGHALSLIRFPLMTIEEFSRGPVRSGILLDHESVSVFQYLISKERSNLEFSTTSRSRLESICRFQTVQKVHSMDRVSGHRTCDMEFSVNCPIRIFGFGVFKDEIDDPKVYQIKVEVKEASAYGGKLIFSNDGTNNIRYRNSSTLLVEFSPIQIDPNKIYSVIITSNRTPAYKGSQAANTKTVSCPACGEVAFNFNPHLRYGFQQGQIPEIVFTFDSY